jgi:hypothetical protein
MSNSFIIFGNFRDIREIYFRQLAPIILPENSTFTAYNLDEIQNVNFIDSKILFIGQKMLVKELLISIHFYFSQLPNEVYVYTDDIGDVQDLKDNILFLNRINKIYTSNRKVMASLGFASDIVFYIPNLFYRYGSYLKRSNDNARINTRFRATYNRFRNATLKNRNVGVFIDSNISSDVVTTITNFCSLIAQRNFYVTLISTSLNTVQTVNQIVTQMLRVSQTFVSSGRVNVVNFEIDVANYFYLADSIKFAFVMSTAMMQFCVLDSIPFCVLDHKNQMQDAVDDLCYPFFLKSTDINLDTMTNKILILDNLTAEVSRYISKRLDIAIAGRNSTLLNDDELASGPTYKPVIDNILDFALAEYDRILIEKSNLFSEQDIDFYAKYFSHILTKDDTSKNLYLKDTIYKLGFDAETEFRSILVDTQSLNPMLYYDNPRGNFNLSIFDQIDKSNVHRHGWRLVFDALAPYQSQYADTILDLYVERTFIWKESDYKNYNIIPYKRNWYGFIHHTFNTLFGNGIGNIFESAAFIESLSFCKGLIVLSLDLQTKLAEYIAQLNVNVPVYFIPHPTELKQNKKFNFALFNSNTSKKLLHVGGWYRNLVSFYLLKTSYERVALKGQLMDGYFPPAKFSLVNEFETENCEVGKCISRCYTKCSSGSDQFQVESSNMWLVMLQQYFKNLQNEVVVFDNVNNQLFDDLLSFQVIFINLVDASAVNTILECISRNTPIIVNRIPATVELLGNTYPLFYTNQTEFSLRSIEVMSAEINTLLTPVRIQAASIYLQNLTKFRYDSSFFLSILFDIL